MGDDATTGATAGLYTTETPGEYAAAVEVTEGEVVRVAVTVARR
ncbi:MAG TPA: hypothetical protein VES02_06390 [Dermatophilaceae bacterium]|nr:hypothetical protein [Dermatophilaceae bacterium]